MEKTSNKPKLIVHTQLDSKDDLEDKLEKCYNFVTSITSKYSEREAADALQNLISRGKHDEIQCGLVYAILYDEKTAQSHYSILLLVSQDSMYKATNLLTQIIYEKWLKLNEKVKIQVVWMMRELVKSGVARTDAVVHNLLRQIAGGDLSPGNLWLTECMLETLIKNRPWLEAHVQLIPSVVFTFVRLMADHHAPSLATLRQKEVQFCVSLLREKWVECQSIGRDLVRLLQAVARIPEIAELFRDMQTQPSKLSPQFTGITQLMCSKTSRNLLISRLTPDMETKLAFLTTQVKFGNQKRYQDWFMKQYLITPESQSLRCDLIRYICSVIHPSNEVLCSDIIPRWAVIGWLLTTCTSNVAASNAKLALFYDWLFYDPDRDSIMNIEPCILVMHNSMRPHPAITATLLDFMCRISTHFHPSLTRQVTNGITNSLNCILEKRVLQSLVPLFNNAKLDKDLFNMLQATFPQFCRPPDPPKSEDLPQGDKNEEEGADNDSDNGASSANDVAYFSDDDDPHSVKSKKNNNSNKNATSKENEVLKAIRSTFSLKQFDLDDQFKHLLNQLINEKDNEGRCEVLDKVLQQVASADALEQEDISELARCLSQLLQLPSKLLPQQLDDESMEDSIGLPVFVIFRNLQQVSEEEQERGESLLLLLEQMYTNQPRLGYYFLYFLKASSKVKHEVNMKAYKDFCKSMDRPLSHYILADLKTCLEDDVNMFSFLVPDIFTQFPSVAVGNVDLMHLIVASIDGIQLQELTCEVLQGHLNMFSKETFCTLLNASLGWQSIEQYFFWQLVTAHDLPPSFYLPIVPKVNFKKHAEAVTSMMMLLKQEGPSAESLKPLLSRPCKTDDLFTVSMLRYWAQEYSDKLADLLNSHLGKLSGNVNKKKMGRTPGKTAKDQPSIEQTLSHLDQLRTTCKDISFLSNESIQQALQTVQTSCSDTLKVKYGDLLALVEDVEESKNTRVLRQVPSRRASQAATKASKQPSKRMLPDNNSDSSDDSSDEEEAVQVMKPKKSKRAVLFED